METPVSLYQERKHAHSQAVGKIAELIAKSSGHINSEAELIKEAARLHDIGKTYIPKEILEKPGKLTTEEFAIVKQHTIYGAEYLLWQAQLLLAAAIMALQHHEHVDGNGYKGITSIHSYAKLVAVADVFDALLSARSYKDGWPPDEIIDYMKENEDKQFEPVYVEALLQNLDDVLAVYDQK